MLTPATEIQYLKGVGPARARVLRKLGIRTVGDLLRHAPREWDDRTRLAGIGGLRPDQQVTVRGRVESVRSRETGSRKTLVSAFVDDGTGVLRADFWNQAFRERQLTPGTDVFLTGRVVQDERGWSMNGPEVEVWDGADGETVHAGRIVPVHPLTKGVHATQLRALVWRALEAADLLADPVPVRFLATRGLPPLGEAVRALHFPPDRPSLDRARRRMAYEDLFLLQTALARRRLRRDLEEKPHRIVADPGGADRVDARIRARFPFRFTAAQDRAVAEIREDLARPQPMHRLLQGDVGSGKTAVAVYAMLACVAAGYQAALLAPTEILAEQHAATLSRILTGARVSPVLVTGRGPERERKKARAAVASGEARIVVGTHAILEEGVRFAALGLVVVDEQHKFGVVQRATLRRKGSNPDVLVMSATPIPRSLTMTLFGDLDLSLIDERPPGRAPVATIVCEEGDRERAYAFARSEIARDRRVFHVVPRVGKDDEPGAASGDEPELKTAIAFRKTLARDVYPGIEVGLLHGKLPGPGAKEAAMEAFRSGRTPVLVATSVVEVGVDVPEATVMFVEHAERFGLAQLHQIRGRVGRGGDPARVFLFHDAKSRDARARLDVLASTDDGFRIAEEDLRIRGPGEFLGTRQHGLPEVKLADLTGDVRLLDEARRDAFEMVRNDPGLRGEGAAAAQALAERFGMRLAPLEA